MDESPRSVTITISGATISKVIVVLVLFFALYVLRDLVLITLTAVFIASAVEPAIRFFRRYKIGRAFAAVIVYICIAGVMAGIFSLFLPILLEETSDFLSSLPAYLPGITIPESVDSVSTIVDNSSSVVKDISTKVDIPSLIREVRTALSSVQEGFWQTVASVFGNVASFILVAVLSFYLAVQQDGVANFLKVIAPIRHRDYVLSLLRRSQEKIGLWIQGQLLLCVLVGILVYLCLMIFQVPHALAFGFLAAVLELIPVFGPVIAAIPAVLSAFAENGAPLGLTVIGIFLLIQQFENHLFYPLVVKKIVGIPPILVILSLIAGWELAGFWGVILSIPLGVVLMEYFNDLQRERLAEEEK